MDHCTRRDLLHFQSLLPFPYKMLNDDISVYSFYVIMFITLDANDGHIFFITWYIEISEKIFELWCKLEK